MFLTRSHILVIVAYAILAVIMSWPVAAHLTDRMVGTGGDPWQTMWRFTNKQSLLEFSVSNSQFSNFFHQEFLGDGEARLVNLSVWPWMPLHILFGQPAAYNLVWLLSFILAGYAMFLLTSHLLMGVPGRRLEIGNWKLEISLPAFLAGVYYMLLPYHVAHSLGHFGAMQTAWLPFIIVTALSYVRAPRFWKSALLGLFLIIQAWTEHHYFLWLIIFAIGAGIYYRKELVSFVAGEIRNWKSAISHTKSTTAHGKSRILFSIFCFLFSILLIAVSYLPTIRLTLQEDTPLNLGREQLIRFSADPFAYIVPASFHPIWKPFIEAISGQAAFEAVGFTGNVSEATHYVGLSMLLLILFFHERIPSRQKFFWAATALVFFVISLGPLLHIFGYITAVHLPYDLIDTWIGVSSIRAVARASVFVGLSMSVLLAFVLAKNIHRGISSAALLLLIVVEFLFWPAPTQSATLSSAYSWLKESPGSAIVEIPAATNYTVGSRALYAETLHGKEVLGNIALERAQPAEDDELIKSVPALRQLLYLRTTELRENRPEFFGQDLTETLPEVIAWFGIPAIIVHPDSLSPLQYSAVRKFLEGQMQLSGQAYEDTMLYDTTSYLTQLPATSDGMFLRRQGGWENVGYDPDRASVFAEIPSLAEVVFVNVRSSPRKVQVTFSLASESPGKGKFLVNGQKLADLIPTGQPITIAVDLLPGENIVQFKTETAERIIIQNPSFQVVSE